MVTGKCLAPLASPVARSTKTAAPQRQHVRRRGSSTDISFVWGKDSRDLCALPLRLRSSPERMSATYLRVASYNVRVDHTADAGTIHAWPLRVDFAASSIAGLGADIVALQEPSPQQGRDIAARLPGPKGTWGVEIVACDPEALKAGRTGQALDGNGFVWRKDRWRLVGGSARSVQLPSLSGIRRTAVIAQFVSLQVMPRSSSISVVSAHFDHLGSDKLGHGSVEKRQSAAAVLELGQQELVARGADGCVVCGDFNTFEDREGDCYKALATAAAATGSFVDVRDMPGVVVADAGRGGASWEGWPEGEFSRRNNPEAANRFDQVFVSRNMTAIRTQVVEDKYRLPALPTKKGGDDDNDGDGRGVAAEEKAAEEKAAAAAAVTWHEVHCSDHLPIVTDLILTPSGVVDGQEDDANSRMSSVNITRSGVLAAFAVVAVVLAIASRRRSSSSL